MWNGGGTVESPPLPRLGGEGWGEGDHLEIGPSATSAINSPPIEGISLHTKDGVTHNMQAKLLSDKLLLAFLALVVWLPLTVGADRAEGIVFFYGLTALWAGVILLVWLVQYARGQRRIPPAARRAWPALVLLGCWVGYIVFQLIPMPIDWVAALSPKAAWVHQLTYHPGGERGWVTLSVNPFRTLLGLHRTLTYALLFLLVLLLVRRFTHLRWLLGALVLGGTLTAAIGLTGFLLGWESMAGGGVLHATFGNRNHLADYLTMSIAAGLGLLLAQLGSGGEVLGRKERLRQVLDWVLSPKMRLRGYLLLMAAAIILTRSRMGNVAFFTSMLMAGGIALLLMRQRSRGMVVLLASLVVIDIFIVGSLIGLDRVVERLERTSLATQHRDEVFLDTLTYLEDFRLVGSGLHTYRDVFQLYKGDYSPQTWARAHNDYLQFLAEAGTVGALLPGLFAAVTFGVGLRALRRRIPWAVGAGFAVLMSSIALFIHSWVEFNLQSIANASAYLIVAGLGWVACCLPVEEPSQRHTRRRRRHMVAIVAAAVLLAHLVGVGRIVVADRITVHNKAQLAQWKGRGDVAPQRMADALDRQLLAIRLTPANAEAFVVAVRLMSKRTALEEPLADEVRHQRYDRMVALALEATRRNPLKARAWLAIAYLRHFEQRYDVLFSAAMRRVSEIAPWEFGPQYDLARVGLAAWDRLPGEAERKITQLAVRHALKQQPGETAKLVEQLGRKELVCQALRGEVVNLCADEQKEE